MATSQYTDTEQACAFLRAHSRVIERALRHPLDEHALDEALGAHDRSHARWARLLTAVEGYGDLALQAEAIALHDLQDRLAGLLERGLDGWFHIEAAWEVRAALADRLAGCTTGVVTMLASAQGAAPRLARPAHPVPM